MCANYLPSGPSQLQRHFGVGLPDSAYPAESFPGYFAPVIKKPHPDGAVGERRAALAMFGLVPQWADARLARQTYNARTETVASKPSFRHAYQQGQFCIIPAGTIFEPSYESGKAERFGITAADGAALGIAGIWEIKQRAAQGPALLSFSMLTINADAHPVMRRFHRPADEKRMLVFLRPEQYDAWLHCAVAEAPAFFVPIPAEMLVVAKAPKPRADAHVAPSQSQTSFDLDT